MNWQFFPIRFAAVGKFQIAAIVLAGFAAGYGSPCRAEEKKPSPCNEDAMIVFDASGSMSGNQTLGIPNSQARIDEVRSALAQVLPSATKFRRVGLVTYGPGPYNQCNVKLEFKPTADAAGLIMSTVNALVPAGKTPLTSGVEQAAEALDFRNKPGVVVVVTDGEETCGRSPCEVAKALHLIAKQLTVHVIGFRYENYSWTGGNTVLDLMCLAEENGGLYIKANSEDELAQALEKTLDCPMVSQASPATLTK
ncbi:MAG: VWA domain-containing protein [Methyloceanibacter sp.]|jgi:Ca-activated chloride channel homolog|nr:VWA domain-containing protein [Methyloceanibacter sp.]